jgi:small-conductance mechanosensitive channel
MFSFRAKSAARFRSADRDRETDQRRLAAIKSAVREALAAAEGEKSALGQRLEQARTRATILAGTDTYEHETRLPEKAVGLAESEAEICRAENRLLDLDRHISKLKKIEGAILDESGNSEPTTSSEILGSTVDG